MHIIEYNLQKEASLSEAEIQRELVEALQVVLAVFAPLPADYAPRFRAWASAYVNGDADAMRVSVIGEIRRRVTAVGESWWYAYHQEKHTQYAFSWSENVAHWVAAQAVAQAAYYLHGGSDALGGPYYPRRRARSLIEEARVACRRAKPRP